MSAAEAKLQVEQMLDEIGYATSTLTEVENKLDSIQGSALLLGLTQSNNQMAAGLIQLVDAAKHNRETLGQFLFHIKNRLNEYHRVL